MTDDDIAEGEHYARRLGPLSVTRFDGCKQHHRAPAGWRAALILRA